MSSQATPILLLVFNRPSKTKVVFEAIRQQQPKQLFIAADGPRADKAGEKELCANVREIVSNVDWDCEVKTLFRGKNLGCGVAPAQAITWFFDNIEQGIILEDDVVPDKSFFLFCEDMLTYYKDDHRIMHISGSYFLESLIESLPAQSYYFTRHVHGWGWATWRRAWNHYDYDMKDWPSLRSEKKLHKYYGEYSIFWKDIFDMMMNKRTDIWDYQWMYALYKHNGVAINPGINLTKNIGFDKDATHTTDINSVYTKIKLLSMSKIIHPVAIRIDTSRDALYYKYFLEFDLQIELHKRNIIWKLKKYLRKLRAKF